MLASDYIASLRVTLADKAAVTWLDADLLLFLAEAERQVCLLKPDAYTAVSSITLVAGRDQMLATTATGLFDIYRNTASGLPCGQVQRSLLDEAMRFRGVPTAEVDVRSWTADTRVPTRFTVQPPNTGAGAVDALIGLIPPAFTAAGNTMHLSDLFQEPIKFFALGEAYAANTKRQDVTKASFYRSEAAKTIGTRTQSQNAVAPHVGAPGGT